MVGHPCLPRCVAAGRCDCNDIFFPLELEPGTVLRIPSVEHVRMRLVD